MQCPSCKSVLTQRNRFGEPIVRNRGIVLKSSGVYLVCPKCRADVAFNPEVLRLAPLVVFPHRRSQQG
jgi:hypothetical protein